LAIASKACDEFGPAIGIARIVERIDPDEQVASARRLRPSEAQRQEDGVSGRHVGDRNVVAKAALGNVDIVGQRRAAELAEVERQDDVPLGAQLAAMFAAASSSIRCR
jgi:hypothetical protein